MTAIHEPELRKLGTGSSQQEYALLHPAAGIPESLWQIIILAISVIVILFSVYCLTHGITIIFMHLYYLPIVLLAYRYRYRGFVLSVILSIIYLSLVLFYCLSQYEIIIGALLRFVVFIGIAAVVAYLSEQFHQSSKTLKNVVEIQESSLMNANVWLMLLDYKGRVLLWNTAAERISGYSAAEVTGSGDIWKLLYPDKEYRAGITKKIERIIAEDSFFENLETTIRTRNGEEKVISWNTRNFPGKTEPDSRSIAIGIDITERKRAEDELRFSERKFSAAFLASPDPIAITDIRSGRILDINRTFEDWSGYTRDEITGKTTRELNFWVYPHDRDSFVELLNTRGFVHKKEVTFRIKSGDLRNILFSARVLETGDNAYMLSLAEDITERKRAEETIRQVNERLRRYIDANIVGVIVAGPSGSIIETNDYYLHMIGYTRGEFEQGLVNWRTLTPPEWLHADEHALEELRERGVCTPYEKAYLRKDGTRVSVFLSDAMLPGPEEHIVAFVLDITERKRVELAMQESEEKFRAIIGQSVDGILIMNGDFSIIEWNATQTAIYGYTREEMLGKPIWEFQYATLPKGKRSPGIFEKMKQSVLDLYNSTDTSWMRNFQDFDVQCKNGQRKTVQISTFPIVFRNTMIFGSFSRDITARKLTEDTLQRVNQKLNILSQLTRKDLTNQIFVLNSYLELAKKQSDGQDLILGNLQKCMQEIKVIHETVEYSKDYQDMGVKPPKWQNVNMAMLFGLSHVPIGDIQHSLETENLEIFADPLLEKVCQRLFENSVKHGEHVTRIRIWHTITPAGLTIIFEDDGIGIAEDRKDQIFVRDDSPRVSRGSLIFVREILDITGIAIRETGEPGKGARFEMIVPEGTFRWGVDSV